MKIFVGLDHWSQIGRNLVVVGRVETLFFVANFVAKFKPKTTKTMQVKRKESR